MNSSDNSNNNTVASFETAVIGMIFLDVNLMSTVRKIIPTEKYFMQPTHRAVYKILLELDNKAELPDDELLFINLLAEYSCANDINRPTPFKNESTAANYFETVVTKTQDSGYIPQNVNEYAERVRWDYDKRTYESLFRERGLSIQGVPYTERESFVDETEYKISQLSYNIAGEVGLMHVRGLTSDTYSKLDSFANNTWVDTTIPTGLDSLDDIIGGFNPGEVTVLAGQTGGGKALPNDSLVPTPNGYKLVGDIRPGDLLFGSDGKPVKVLSIHPQEEEKEKWNIMLNNYLSIDVSPDHLWCVWENTPYEILSKIATPSKAYENGIKQAKNDGARTNNVLVLSTRDLLNEMKLGRTFIIPKGPAIEFDNSFDIINTSTAYYYGKLLPFIYAKDIYEHELLNIVDSIQYFNIIWSYDKSTQTFTILNNDDINLPSINDIVVSSLEARMSFIKGIINSRYAKIYDDGNIKLILGNVEDSDTIDNYLDNIQRIINSTCFSSSYLYSFNNTEDNNFSLENMNVNIIVNIYGNRNDIKDLINQTQIKNNISKKNIDSLEYKLETVLKSNQILGIFPSNEKTSMTCFTVDSKDHLFLIDNNIITHNTALSLVIGENIAIQQDRSILIFSLEMMEEQLINRMVARLGHVDFTTLSKQAKLLALGSDTLTTQQKDQISTRVNVTTMRAKTALSLIEELPIYITVNGDINTNMLRSMIIQKQKELKSLGKPELGLVIIDYLQLLTPLDPRASAANRTQVVGEISRAVKQIAKTCSVPILLLSQLSRSAAPGEAPELRHLRESGSIEQDADRVLFIWSEFGDSRQGDYDITYTDPVQKYLAITRDKMPMKIRVAKNRQGRSGDAEILFDAAYADFVSKESRDTRDFQQFFEDYYINTRKGSDLFTGIRELFPLEKSVNNQSYKHKKKLNELYKHSRTPYLERQYIDSNGSIIRNL